MRIELILLVVIVFVVVIDIVLRILKKKSSNDKDLSRENKFNYILNRKRNIITFLLLTAILKPLIHYVFFEEKSNVYDSKKILLGDIDYFDDFNLKDSTGILYKVDHQSDPILVQRDSKYYYRANVFIDIESGKATEFIESDFLHNGGVFTSSGDKLYMDKKNVFMYNKKNINFNEYLNQYFLFKPYIFMISFGIMLLFVLLFNDKIKAR